MASIVVAPSVAQPWSRGSAIILKEISNKVTKFGREINFTLPKKYEGTVIDRAVTFWKNLYLDYHSAVTDTVVAARAKPKKAVFYFTGCGLLAYCAKRNPDEMSYRDELLASSEDLMVIPSSVRNPAPTRELEFIEKCYNEGKIRCFSFGILSFMWFTNYDNDSGIYEAQCSYLNPQVVSLPSRFIDIGFLGKWWRLSTLMKNHDVSYEEFL